MKIYISGKISGLPLEEAKQNFDKAEKALKQKGHEVISPMSKEGFDPNMGWKEHMVEDVRLMLQCDALYMLENWPDSRGAKLEKYIATKMGMEIIYQAVVKEEREKKEKTEQTIYKVESAIHEVTGLRLEDYAVKSKKRGVYFCRVIFVQQCFENDLTDVYMIAKLLNKDRVSVLRSLNKYIDEYKFNPSFREWADKVDGILQRA